MFNCLKALKNNEEALKYSLMLENFEELKNSIYLLSNIANLYEEKQDYKEQLKYLEKIEKIGIDDLQFYIEYGYCLMFLEYYREAISKFEKSLGSGKDTYCISQIAYCYTALGNKEKAKYHMDSSIEALGAYAESEEYLKKRFTEIKEMINSLK